MKLLKGLALLCVFSVALPLSLSSYKINAAVNAQVDQQSVLLMSEYQSRVRWRSSKEFKVSRKSGGSTDTYKKDTVYTGMPYTQESNKKIGEFLDQCTYNGGKANLSNISNRNTLDLKSSVIPATGVWNYGNDCSTAVAIAWSTCFPQMNYAAISTSDLMSCAKNGTNSTYHLRTVAGYKIGNITNTASYCSSNSDRKNAVIGYYRAMLPGDSLFRRNDSSGKGHAMLVYSVSLYGVRVTEQCGLSGTSSWKRNKYYSFDELYSNGYLPVYCTNVARS